MFSSKRIGDMLMRQPGFAAKLLSVQQAQAAQPVTPDTATHPVERDLTVAEPNAPQANPTQALPGPYVTQLSPTLEAHYRQWVKGAGIPTDPDHPQPDYDTRGLWNDHGWRAATQMYQRPDYQRKLPATYRTPFHRQFSPQSQYAVQNAAIMPVREPVVPVQEV